MKMLVALLVAGASFTAHATHHRSYTAKSSFQRTNPCPSTGLRRGACPGYVKDHVIPLCAGGPDEPSNMQWQTVEEAKIKDREERRICRTK